jgi:hypothetical protein
MSEATPKATPTDAPAQEQPKPGENPPAAETPPTVEELQAKVEELTKESRKWEGRAKENGKAKTELEKQRQAAMTDAERAVAEAEERGRTAAITELGKDLAKERFDALAGRRNPNFDTAQALEYVDLGKFLGEDGRPDTQAITAAVERLVPAADSGPPSFDGGTRTPAPAPQGMTQIIRKAAGRA